MFTKYFQYFTTNSTKNESQETFFVQISLFKFSGRVWVCSVRRCDAYTNNSLIIDHCGSLIMARPPARCRKEATFIHEWQPFQSRRDPTSDSLHPFWLYPSSSSSFSCTSPKWSFEYPSSNHRQYRCGFIILPLDCLEKMSHMADKGELFFMDIIYGGAILSLYRIE